MKKVFIDTNVFIDYIAHRAKFYEQAAAIVSLADYGLFQLIVSSLSFATSSYILESHYKKTPEEILNSYREFVDICRIATVDDATIRAAIRTPFSDFEDAMEYHAALAESADCIVTRNKKDFLLASFPILTPHEFLDMITI